MDITVGKICPICDSTKVFWSYMPQAIIPAIHENRSNYTPMISVIIPCYNDHSLLVHTLESLEKQSDPGLFEVIIVDSSENGFQYSGPIVTQYLHQNERLYAGLARNLGVKVASGDVLVFLDSKVMPAQTALKRIAGLPLENKIYSASLEISPLSSLWGQFKHRLFFHEFQNKRKAGERKNLPSTFLIMSREAFLGSGGFTGLKRHQDAEYTERMKRKGYQLLFEPSVECWLVNAENARELLYKMYFDGAGYASKVGISRALLLPGIGILKFARIGLRNLWWRRDIFSALLFLPTISMSLVWVAGGISAITGFVSSESVTMNQVGLSSRSERGE